MTYRDPDWKRVAEERQARIAILESDLAESADRIEWLQDKLDARPGPLARAWRSLVGWQWWRELAGGLTCVAAIGALAWFIWSNETKRDAEAQALCEHVCGESLIDVRRNYGTTCLCEGDAGLYATEPWRVDE